MPEMKRSTLQIYVHIYARHLYTKGDGAAADTYDSDADAAAAAAYGGDEL